MIKPSGNKVVYWIGAGASANALPTVNEFDAALRSQHGWIENIVQDELLHLDFDRYKEKLRGLAKLARKHGTIDTYARVLFMRKQVEELAELKLHLAMFFLLEQAAENKDWSTDADIEPAYSKPDRIDTRYMTWLAQVMDNNSMLSARVRIISWNYDLQIEHAVGVYRGLQDLTELHTTAAFQVYPNLKGSNMDGSIKPSLVHLNGIAGHAESPSATTPLYRDLVKENPKQYITRLFELYKDYDRGDRFFLNSMFRTFNFAWEENHISRPGVDLAKQCLAEAKVLVIIGYSFPAFNRTIDIELMQSFLPPGRDNRDRKIVVQNPTMKQETFEEIFSINKMITNIKVLDQASQFYLPPDLFN